MQVFDDRCSEAVVKHVVLEGAEDLALAQAAFESTVWRTDFDPTVNLEAIDESAE